MLPSEKLASRRTDILALAHARGHDHEGSDVDLLVDLPPETSLLRIVGRE